MALGLGCASGGSKRSNGSASEDPHLWLEEVESPRALEWVKARSAKAESVIESTPAYQDIEADIRKVVLAPDRLPLGSYRGGFVYNFWQDEKNVRGLWRRASLKEYAEAKPKWTILLDVDALAAAEKENWIFKGASCLPPEGRRCLLTLSRGGKDASVVREFDVERRTFVTGGFEIPEAKSHSSWNDENSIWVGTDMGPGSLTKSGYPRQVRLWRRGETLAQSILVYQAMEDDMSASAWTSIRPEGRRSFVRRTKDFFSGELFRVDSVSPVKGAAPKLAKITIPDDAETQGDSDGRIFFLLRSEWKTPKRVFPAGALVALPLEPEGAAPELAYAPSSRVSFQSLHTLRGRLLLTILDRVQKKILRLKRSGSEWSSEVISPDVAGASYEVQAENDFEDRALVYEAGFLRPSTLSIGDFTSDTSKPRSKALRSLQARFDSSQMVTEQLEATSTDGEKIPYFVVRNKQMKFDGTAPALLYGYGGFEISMTPDYLGAVGKVWLEKRSGVYALANIRGGGEFGPRWHKAAILENRQKAFDDFAAVAADMIARKITSPPKLGIMGGSNGGLLVGTVFTQRPELFGAVVCQVPLLDMLRYHKLLAGHSWMAEYGDPDDPNMASTLKRYSPYQNIQRDIKYPPILFLTSTKDDRVHPGHARKMMARLEEVAAPALFWENTEGGHGGAANLEQRIKFSALGWAFLWSKLEKSR